MMNIMLFVESLIYAYVPIIARITIDQVVAQFNTKLEINPAHWSVKLGKASGRTAEAVHINSMLESIHSTVPQQD